MIANAFPVVDPPMGACCCPSTQVNGGLRLVHSPGVALGIIQSSVERYVNRAHIRDQYNVRCRPNNVRYPLVAGERQFRGYGTGVDHDDNIKVTGRVQFP